MIRSYSTSQDEILDAIEALHALDGFDVDVTYGNGVFYKNRRQPQHCYDIDPQLDHVIEASSDALPLEDASVGSLMFDPPFLTYVRAGREGNGEMLMAKRFGGYWRYDELRRHYVRTIHEASRVLRKGGILVVKCQDIIHNHKMHSTHSNVIRWAEDSGFRLKDSFILLAGGNLPSPNRAGKQKHARISHSYFLVFENTEGKR